ncbi:STELLO glycosyltransferase family protein [Bacteroidota bacterium]
MKASRSLVITTIATPNMALQGYATECRRRDIDFIVVGDRKSPHDFSLPGSDFWSLERQKESEFRAASIIPENHYARKNIGYLASIKKGHNVIMETDDDNIPYDTFWKTSEREFMGTMISHKDWVNVFSLFSGEKIWPRGFPLEHLEKDATLQTGGSEKHHCPIQQGLADENPDVDAVFRLTHKLPLKFQKNLSFVLDKGSWCPFNSQNTVWFKEAFPLLYLPSNCSFRMTDIWRSFVAQRIAWEYGWKIAFYSPTVYQERNEHNLLKDFEDEVPGYLNNAKIASTLELVNLSDRQEDIFGNLFKCYQALIKMNLVGKEEIDILQQWIHDLQKIL